MALKVPSPYEKALAERQAKYAEQFDRLRQLAGVTTGVVRGTDINRFGAELPLYVQAAVVALHGAGAAYGALPFSAGGLSEEGRELADLLLFKGFLDQLMVDTSALCQNRAAELGRKVGLVIKATDSTVDHPGLEEATRRQTQNAAAPLRELCSRRNESIKVSMAASKAQRDSEADKDTENSRLKLENRFLAGEPLKPADLAQPTAPRAGRRRNKR